MKGGRVSHFVKCKVCGERFDRDKEAAVDVGGRRYAHAKCADGYAPSQEVQDLDNLHKYLKTLFKSEYNYIVLQKQIENYIKNNKYSVTGIHKTLVYWYEVQGNSTEKSNGRLGIVPYVYQDAYQYYLNQFLAKERNLNKNIREYKEFDVIEIKIKTPQKPSFLKRKLFNLDD